jgi:hypothetical protein
MIRAPAATLIVLPAGCGMLPVARQKFGLPTVFPASLQAATKSKHCTAALPYLQVGQYLFNVAPPTNLPGMVVFGTPLAVYFTAGMPSGNHSSVSIIAPPQPAVGSVVTASIYLRDAYNVTTTPGEGIYNNSYVVVAERGAQA